MASQRLVSRRCLLGGSARCLAPICLLSLVLAPLGAIAETHNPRSIHGNAVPFKPMTEEERVALFRAKHGAWPDPKLVAKEHPGFTRRMEERTEEVMRIPTFNERWDQWMALAQARIVPTFTENQYEVVTAPEHIHKKLYERFHQMLPTAKDEGAGSAPVRGVTSSLFFPQEELNYEILDEMTPYFAKWAGVPVEPTSVYGVRVYRDGQTLVDHVDVMETHVISGILHIDSDLDEPWPIQMDNAKGVMGSVSLKPGQLCFYESAKTFHQRMHPLKGRYYASIFMHYRPIGWNYTKEDSRIAIPDWWNRGLSEDSSRQPAGSIEVTFSNDSPVPVDIFWIVPGSEQTSADGREQMQFINKIPPGAQGIQNTFLGHRIVARSENEEVHQIFTMNSSHRGQVISLSANHAEL